MEIATIFSITQHSWLTWTRLCGYKLYLDAKISIPLPISLPPQDKIVATSKPPAAQSSSRRIGTNYDTLIEDTVRQQLRPSSNSRCRLLVARRKWWRIAKKSLKKRCWQMETKAKETRLGWQQSSTPGKNARIHSAELLVDELMELFTAEEKIDIAEAEEKSIAANVEEKVTGDEAKQDSGDDQPQEKEEVSEVKEYRVVSKTLKGIIKESFDYQLLFQRMEGLQDSCHKTMKMHQQNTAFITFAGKWSGSGNRDSNGANNIAMIGFSSLISEDSLPLPAFRRTQSSKYALSALFLSHQTHGEDRIPTKGGDIFGVPRDR
ncbi:hypothetical protein [Parasitella parasitica]|uniref:Uncharacterized protein n=1 Tax=Parasitella parasitica TaxID=35722 RepID=A0A0B7N9M5_9FUNG|nr:hypothetical protein [Parasitella parasitica]